MSFSSTALLWFHQLQSFIKDIDDQRFPPPLNPLNFQYRNNNLFKIDNMNLSINQSCREEIETYEEEEEEKEERLWEEVLYSIVAMWINW